MNTGAVVVALLLLAIASLFVVRRLGRIGDAAFQRYAAVATILGLPLAILAYLFPRNPPPQPPRPDPTPSPVIARMSPTPASPSPPPSPADFSPPTPLQPVVRDQQDVPNEPAQSGPLEQRDRRVAPTAEQGTIARRPYTSGDIGLTKENGYYEVTVENATVSFNPRMCVKGFVNVSNEEKMVAVRFSIRAVHLRVPSIPTGQDFSSYYLVDSEGRRFEMRCGDGRYFNVSLNSFQEKPVAKTLTVEFLVPRDTHEFKFLFSPRVGNAISFNLPNSI